MQPNFLEVNSHFVPIFSYSRAEHQINEPRPKKRSWANNRFCCHLPFGAGFGPSNNGAVETWEFLFPLYVNVFPFDTCRYSEGFQLSNCHSKIITKHFSLADGYESTQR